MSRPWLGVVRAALLLAAPLAVVSAGEANILDVASEMGVVLEWDSLSRSGAFVLGTDRVAFAVGRSWLLANGREKIEIGKVTAADGAVFVEGAAADLVASWFASRGEAEGRWRIGAILIDPGHGGKDPGTNANHTINEKTVTVREKDIVLAVGLRLSSLLRERYPSRLVLLSREDDTYLSLEERTEMANSVPLGKNEAIIFISIHANSALVPKPRGFEVWIQPPEYRREVLSEDELGEDERELWPMLNSMREDELNLESSVLAELIISGLKRTIGAFSPSRGIKQEAWAVVRNALMPAVLVELGFVSNPEEAAMLIGPEYQQQLAEGIYDGVDAFVRKFEGSMNFLP